MPRELFHDYSPKDRALVEQICEIADDYVSQGFRLTLRQLYYQCVTKNLIVNDEKVYKRIGAMVSDARVGGWLDWDAIEDRGRQPKIPTEFDSIEEIMEAAMQQFRLPRFAGQRQYIELWVEKDALAGVLQPIASAHHVALVVNKGYSSTSAMYAAAERIREACKTLECHRAHVLYLGDLDPSGEDMVRDVDDRLDTFVNNGLLVLDETTSGDPYELESQEDSHERKPDLVIKVEKLALTMEQVRKYNPPPNPAKLTDSRAKAFIEKYGPESYEVDALTPRVLKQIIETRLRQLIDMDKMGTIIEQENRDRERLRKALTAVKRK